MQPIVTDSLHDGPVQLARAFEDFRCYQTEGVQFILDRWLREGQNSGGSGVLLADGLGFGKTAQAIAAIYTMFESGRASKIVVVAPPTLLFTWEKEILKWLGAELAFGVCKGRTRTDIVESIESFSRGAWPVILMSYDTFREHLITLRGCSVDIIVWDEGHRLKNPNSKTVLAAMELRPRWRLLISATLFQNRVEEFYTICNVVNPGCLGDIEVFMSAHGNVLKSKADDIDAVAAAQDALADRVGHFLLMRTSRTSSELPPKLCVNIFVSLSTSQATVYQSVAVKDMVHGPLYVVSKLEQVVDSLPNHVQDLQDSELRLPILARVQRFIGRQQDMPTKLAFCLCLLGSVTQLHPKDGVVVVSNKVRTLRTIAETCHALRLQTASITGDSNPKQRRKAENDFNISKVRILLLSSKAGGCGLNLMGGCTMILCDPDWNPANDKQAAGRVWRTGQQRPCVIYRLFSTGTIDEEKLIQQVEKVRLGERVVPAKEQLGLQAALASRSHMFTLKRTASAAYDYLAEAGFGNVGAGCGCSEDDLGTWSMHRPPFADIHEPALREAIWSFSNCRIEGTAVTFIMQLEVGGTFTVRVRRAVFSDDEDEPAPEEQAMLSDDEDEPSREKQAVLSDDEGEPPFKKKAVLSESE